VRNGPGPHWVQGLSTRMAGAGGGEHPPAGGDGRIVHFKAAAQDGIRTGLEPYQRATLRRNLDPMAPVIRTLQVR